MVARIMKMEDISNGYFSGPKCDHLNYLDDLEYSDDNYDYEEYSGDSEGDIYENEYDYSDEVDEESRSARDIDSFKQEPLNALSSFSYSSDILRRPQKFGTSSTT